MKQFLIIFFAILCTSISFSQEVQNQSKKVAVYVTGGQDAGVNKVLGDQLVAALAKSGKYVAIERTNSFLAQLGKEQGYQRTGAVSDDEISRLGKFFGVQFVCVAEVSDVFGQKYVSARVIDVESAQVIQAANTSSNLANMQDLLNVSNDLAIELFGSNEEKILNKKQIAPNVFYAAYVQTKGWLPECTNGYPSGTTGEKKRLEAFQIRLDCKEDIGGIQYSAHVQSFGWLPFAKNGEIIGKIGLEKRIEAVKIELTGVLKTQFDVYYRVHIEHLGWSDWVFNGITAGTTGQALRIEAFEVNLKIK